MMILTEIVTAMMTLSSKANPSVCSTPPATSAWTRCAATSSRVSAACPAREMTVNSTSFITQVGTYQVNNSPLSQLPLSRLINKGRHLVQKKYLEFGKCLSHCQKKVTPSPPHFFGFGLCPKQSRLFSYKMASLTKVTTLDTTTIAKHSLAGTIFPPLLLFSQFSPPFHCQSVKQLGAPRFRLLRKIPFQKPGHCFHFIVYNLISLGNGVLDKCARYFSPFPPVLDRPKWEGFFCHISLQNCSFQPVWCITSINIPISKGTQSL